MQGYDALLPGNELNQHFFFPAALIVMENSAKQIKQDANNVLRAHRGREL